MKSRVPTGDTIFEDDRAAIKRGSSGIAHFAVSSAKGAGAKDAKAKKKKVLTPTGKGSGAKDAKAKKKLVITNQNAKVPGAADMKIMRRKAR